MPYAQRIPKESSTELSPGLYSVRWKVLSEADGHFTQGLLVFGVGEGIDLGAAVAAETGVSVPPLEVLLRWLNFSLLAALAGAVAVVHLVLSPAMYPQNADAPVATARRAAKRRVLAWAICLWSDTDDFPGDGRTRGEHPHHRSIRQLRSCDGHLPRRTPSQVRDGFLAGFSR